MNDVYVTLKSHALVLEGYMCSLDKRPAMVICHPHPLNGGSMDSSVVLALRDAAWALGIGTLRFNFRGTGRSEGEHSDGVHEIDDAISAVGFLRSQNVDIDSIYIAGYSFGAGIALKTACLDERIKKVVAVASPAHYEYDYLASCKTPKLFILGEFDEVAPPKRMKTIIDSIPGSETRIIKGADHFFYDELDQVKKCTEEFLAPPTMYKESCGK